MVKVKAKLKYRGSHPKPLFEHGERLSGGIITCRRWSSAKTWVYTVLLPNCGIIYVNEPSRT